MFETQYTHWNPPREAYNPVQETKQTQAQVKGRKPQKEEGREAILSVGLFVQIIFIIYVIYS